MVVSSATSGVTVGAGDTVGFIVIEGLAVGAAVGGTVGTTVGSDVGAKVRQSSSYHWILSLLLDPEAASISPSRSTSAITTDDEPAAASLITYLAKFKEVPSFWYQAISSWALLAASTSFVLSPSRSPA